LKKNNLIRLFKPIKKARNWIWKDNIIGSASQAYRHNLNRVKRNKQKIIAIVFMVTSITVLVTIMFQGKMLGREMSAQQAVIKEQFPAKKKFSEPEDVLDQLSPQQLEHHFHLERTFVILLVMLISVVIFLFLLSRKATYTQGNLQSS
jgi:hypothetical protein